MGTIGRASVAGAGANGGAFSAKGSVGAPIAGGCYRSGTVQKACLAGVVLALAGCEVGPDFSTPNSQVADKWLEFRRPPREASGAR